MSQKFSCQKCGNCCMTFSRNNPKNNSVQFGPDGFKIMMPAQGNVIFGFEKHLFPGSSVKIGECYFDEKFNKAIIINYRVSQPCPMLKHDNTCSVYDSRPITCREFPCPYGDADELRATGTICGAYGFCPAELPQEELDKELGISVKNGNASFVPNNLRKKLLERYGDSFMYALWRYKTYEILRKFVSQLQNQRHVSLAREGCDIKQLEKDIEKCEKIDIFDLYEKYTGQKLYNPKKIEEAIEGMRREIEAL